MKKIILSQGLNYDDSFVIPFSWTADIIKKLVELNSSLIIFSEDLESDYETINNIIWYSLYNNDIAVFQNDKYYHFNYEAVENESNGRENKELIQLLESNKELCCDGNGNIVFKVIQVPDDVSINIKRKNIGKFEEEYIEELENINGWHDSDLAIVAFALPRIRILRAETITYPNDFENVNEWKQELDNIIFELECYKIERGRNLSTFFKWFNHLWH